MHFKIDENLPPEIALHLRQHGHDATTVWDEQLRGSADNHLIEVCRREGRILLTLDLDFADIRLYPPREYPGLIVLRLHSQSRRLVMTVVSRFISFLAEHSPLGALWFVTENGVRIYAPDEPSPGSISST